MNRILSLLLIFFFLELSADSPDMWKLLANKDFGQFETQLLANPDLAKARKYNGQNLLEVAILNSAPIPLVQTLLDLGSDVNNQSSSGPISSVCLDSNACFNSIETHTPLYAAWKMQNGAVLQLLINYGADPDKVLLTTTTYDVVPDYGPPRFGEPFYHWTSLQEL